MTRRLVSLFVAVVLAGCSGSDGPEWGAIDDLGWPPVLDGTTVVTGDGWRFDAGLQPLDTGEARELCLQLVVADQPLGCIPIGGEPGTVYGLGTAVRVDDERIIWRASSMTDDEPPVGHYVVWSSASPTGRRLDPIRYSDVESLLWIMEPGEAPWGYQTIGDDGTLVAHTTFVGLPAD